jgi:hypothetical protein
VAEILDSSGSESGEILADMLQKMEHVEQISLEVNENKIGSEGSQPFFEAIRYLKNIKDFSLNFSGNVVGLLIIDWSELYHREPIHRNSESIAHADGRNEEPKVGLQQQLFERQCSRFCQ